jgi:leucyl/phenylalanyl-tRNA--protein transferase
LVLEKARAPRKLKRLAAKAPFNIKFDFDFSAVIAGCAEAKPGREDTWINEPIEDAYRELFRRGFVHTVECWSDDALVGGLYGVALGGAFCGESMFSRVPNASKIALLHLIERLKKGGFIFLDAQFHTEHLAQFGVEALADEEYQKLLADALKISAQF